jgi:class 3 adenylate cyclase/CHASE2 domain-containing sensor protein
VTPTRETARQYARHARAAMRLTLQRKGRSSSFAATVIGALLTLLVAFLLMAGYLEPAQQYFHDWRARFCQFGRPPPTDSLVILSIDDRALDVVGRWPWSRELQAQILAEVALAQPKAVALDILHDTPDELRLVRRDDDGPQGPAESYIQEVDGDALLAASLNDLHNTILAFSFAPSAPSQPSPVLSAAMQLLEQNPGLTPELALATLEQRGIILPSVNSERQDLYLMARRRALALRVVAALDALGPDATAQSIIQHAIRPKSQPSPTTTPSTAPADTAPSSENSAAARIAQRIYDSEVARRKLTRFGTQSDRELLDSTSVMTRPVDFTPIPAFTDAAGYVGFVTFPKSSDGRVRALPIVAEYQSRVFPGLGLALAMRYLDVAPYGLKLDRSAVTLVSAANQPLATIPTHTAYYSDSRTRAGGSIDLAFFGGNRWENMFDPKRQRPVGMLSILSVWEILDLQRRLETNRRQAAQAQREVASRISDVEPLFLPLAGSPDPEETQKIRRTLALAAELHEFASSLPAADLDADTKKFLSAFDALRTALAQNPRLQENITAKRSDLRERLSGKAVLVGFTATGATDYVPTSLHASAPGVITHAVVFNSIVTGNTLTRLPDWLEVLLTLIAGAIVTSAVARLNAAASAAVTIAVIVVYLIFNGWVLYGPLGYILGVAGPVVAATSVWAGCTLTRYVYEQAEKRSITRRFQSYVDPKLVNYVLAHPEKTRLDGERRIMTVVFTDLAGFTTISEKLGEATVGLLNEYFELMVPLVRTHNGYMNKFLGDGMMFFFNAPDDNPNHARDAVLTVLEMQQALVDFNTALAERGLPAVKMRAGITTGPMVVGDAGSTGANDYTVLGDAVNLAARLESANKASGTLILASRGVIDHMGEGFLHRPVGKLQVMGKTEGVETFNILGQLSTSTDHDRKLCAATRQFVEAYTAGKFMKCIDLVNDFEEDFGPSKLSHLYHDLCEQRLREGIGTNFTGLITLSEK